MPNVRAIPEGLNTITPHLVVKDASKAIEFYKQAFGAIEIRRFPGPENRGVWHASVRIGDSSFFLVDEALSPGTKSAQSLGNTPVTLQLNVENCDAIFNQAQKAGAKVKMPLMDMFWGDRYGQLVDPFGNTWAISTHVRDVTEDEMRKGAEKAAKDMRAQA
jgi:uncharacterized glyoxalase superfamily protein PhnB